jgi:hypothetical protein
LRSGEEIGNRDLVGAVTGLVVQIGEQGQALLVVEGEEGLIQQNGLGPLLAAAQDEFAATDALSGSGLIDQLALLLGGPQLKHLIATHAVPEVRVMTLYCASGNLPVRPLASFDSISPLAVHASSMTAAWEGGTTKPLPLQSPLTGLDGQHQLQLIQTDVCLGG